MLKRLILLLAVSAACTALMIQTALATALQANSQYTISVSKVNSDGTLTAVDSTTATTDANGRLNFTLTTIPNKDEANFVVFQLRNALGEVVKQGFAPAPPTGDTNLVGINDLADIQAQALRAAATDDPILVAYMLIILRSTAVNQADIPVIAQMGSSAITGTGGFQDFLTSDAGVTATQLANLKKCLIYNADSTKKTLRNFGENFYNAVRGQDASGAAVDERSEMQRAGGFMAEVFMDAAVCAGIEPELVLAAHNAAGDAAGSGEGGAPSGPIGQLMTQNPNFMRSIDQAMSSFHRRIAGAKVAAMYTDALTALNGSGSQVDRFLAAGQTMFASYEQIESAYGEYFMNPQTYLAAHPDQTAETVRAAIDALYQSAFTTFQTDMASSNSDIDSLKTKVALLLGVSVSGLPPAFGTNTDFSGVATNWPIPQTVMVGWLADLLISGKQFTYTQATSPAVPSWANWMGSCSTTQYYDQGSCQSNGGTWTVGRRNFTGMTPVAAYNAFMTLQQDVNVLELNRWSLYQNGAQPTRAQENQAKLDFENGMDALMANIGGDVTSDQKEAIITLLKQPSMD